MTKLQLESLTNIRDTLSGPNSIHTLIIKGTDYSLKAAADGVMKTAELLSRIISEDQG